MQKMHSVLRKMAAQLFAWITFGLVLCIWPWEAQADLFQIDSRYPSSCYRLQETVVLGNSSCFDNPNLLFTPVCEGDGTYLPMQCLSSGYCFCLHIDGTFIKGTLHHESEIWKPDCRNQRAPCTSRKISPQLLCDANGFYQPLQCTSTGQCSCMERNGEVIPFTEHHVNATSNKPDCNKHRTVNFECKKDKLGIYPHPWDCERFLHCKKKGTFVCLCPSKLHFNAKLKRCDWPKQAGCIV